MINFKRTYVLPITQSGKRTQTWNRDHSTHPSVVRFNGNLLMYFRGVRDSAPGTIGIWFAPDDASFNGRNWEQRTLANPYLSASSNNPHESGGLLNPAACVFQNKVFLFYQGFDAAANSHITLLATSKDAFGFEFDKRGAVLYNATSPTPLVIGNTLHLFYRKLNAKGGYAICKRTTTDGIAYGPEQLVFDAGNNASSFDFKSIVNVRFVQESPWVYMIYAGSSLNDTYPEGLGIARSLETNLLSWERYGNNPVLLRGAAGTWEEGAINVGAPFRAANGNMYMAYEAVGSRQLAGGPISNDARDNEYGNYSINSYSDIGMAILPPNVNLLKWDIAADFPNGAYRIRNAMTGKYLGTAGGLTNVGTLATQFTAMNASTLWHVQRFADGFYQISAAAGGALAPGQRVLQVDGASRAEVAFILLNNPTGNPNQQWQLSSPRGGGNGEGNFFMINRNSGMSVRGISKADNAAAIQMIPFGHPRDLWTFIPANPPVSWGIV